MGLLAFVQRSHAEDQFLDQLAGELAHLLWRRFSPRNTDLEATTLGHYVPHSPRPFPNRTFATSLRPTFKKCQIVVCADGKKFEVLAGDDFFRHLAANGYQIINRRLEWGVTN